MLALRRHHHHRLLQWLLQLMRITITMMVTTTTMNITTIIMPRTDTELRLMHRKCHWTLRPRMIHKAAVMRLPCEKSQLELLAMIEH